MLEGRELIRATLPFIREEPRRSWFNFAVTIVPLGAALGIGAFPMLPWWVRLASTIPSALLICRFFILFHDHQHGAIFRASRTANVIMTVFGLLVLSPRSTWNASHNHHHKNNGKMRSASIGSFPVMSVESWRRASRRQRFAYALARHPLTILLAWFTVFLIGMTSASLVRKPREHLDCALAIALHVGLWLVLGMFAPGALLFCFVLPFSMASALGAYLFYVQHNFPSVDLGDQSEWDYVFAALRSSSFLKTNRIMHWFTGNIGYHHIHHLNARIPFYRLPEAMRALAELQAPGTTTLTPWGIFRAFRLKLWDPGAHKMVGFPAA